MRLLTLVFIIFLLAGRGVNAQTDTSLKTSVDTGFTNAPASVIMVPDTIPASIRMPDSLRHDQYLDTLLKQYAFDPFLFNSHTLKQTQLRMGHERPSRDIWEVFVIMLLLIYGGIINRVMSVDVLNVIQSFYLKQSFNKLSREDNLLTSWAFIFLFALFGFTFGLYIYQVTRFYNQVYSIAGVQLFWACTVIVVVLCVVKILALRILGYIFNITRITGGYIAILYVTYFNLAFIFLPVVICFSLLPAIVTPYLLDVSIGLVGIVVAVQYFRSIFNIISNFTFHKIYLFIYLCALEICPVLVIIKALNL